MAISVPCPPTISSTWLELERANVSNAVILYINWFASVPSKMYSPCLVPSRKKEIFVQAPGISRAAMTTLTPVPSFSVSPGGDCMMMQYPTSENILSVCIIIATMKRSCKDTNRRMDYYCSIQGQQSSR